MNKVPIFHHYTEFLDETHEYLKSYFRSDDLELLDFGADIRVGDARVEVKACQEYTKSKHSNGGRRRGRFKFDHFSDSDFILFLLIKEDGLILKRLIQSDTFYSEFLEDGSRTSINHFEIFV